VEFCFNQLNDLAPQALRLSKGRLEAGTLVEQVSNKIQTDQWNEQLGALMVRIIKAETEYIKLLEKRIGK
jgi:hypothetical protein